LSDIAGPGFSTLTADFPHDFGNAARSVLRFLHDRMGMSLWMVTRTRGDDWIVLQIEDSNYGVEAHSVFRWTDSYCSRMVAGFGPRIAPHSAAVPAYADAPIGRALKIGAYVGVPLNNADGTLFGTLCAIHPEPRPETITHELPLIELLASMLSGLLSSELSAAESARRAERALAEAETDTLTGLYNRRGWDRLLAAEEARCRRYGHPACVVAVDLNGLKRVNDTQGHAAGDQFIRRAGQALGMGTRDSDVVARVGGDEFAVLGVERGEEESRALLDRVRRSLEAAGVPAALGLANRQPSHGLQSAWNLADQAMYLDKPAMSRSRTA
jgi:diguanylate cyclase (GGDEF)-like protein